MEVRLQKGGAAVRQVKGRRGTAKMIDEREERKEYRNR